MKIDFDCILCIISTRTKVQVKINYIQNPWQPKHYS